MTYKGVVEGDVTLFSLTLKLEKSVKELIFKILTYKVVAEGDVTFKTNFTLSGDKDHLGKHAHI